MNPAKVRRDCLETLTDLPNIGPALAGNLLRIGIRSPSDLIGRDPYDMYEKLCVETGARHDPCVLDVFISVTRFIGGQRAQSWWEFTAERKRVLASNVK